MKLVMWKEKRIFVKIETTKTRQSRKIISNELEILRSDTKGNKQEAEAKESKE